MGLSNHARANHQIDLTAHKEKEDFEIRKMYPLTDSKARNIECKYKDEGHHGVASHLRWHINRIDVTESEKKEVYKQIMKNVWCSSLRFKINESR